VYVNVIFWVFVQSGGLFCIILDIVMYELGYFSYMISIGFVSSTRRWIFVTLIKEKRGNGLSFAH